jgi:alkylated DNA repair dioxygenase AlkB
MEKCVINIEVLDFIRIHRVDTIIARQSRRQNKCTHVCENYSNINTKFNYSYNGILINKYTDGQDYIGKHTDDERGLDGKVGVISISYGAVRKFRICNKITGKIEIDVPTDPTKIIQMVGNFQKEFTHEIPIEKKIKDTRYSLTFRKHYT